MPNLIDRIDMVLLRYDLPQEVTDTLKAAKDHLQGGDAVDRALKRLSYSEMQTVRALMESYPTGGLVVTSQIAERVGITRSVMVNALRKLESAGLVRTRSLGMKGTMVEILAPTLAARVAKAA